MVSLLIGYKPMHLPGYKPLTPWPEVLTGRWRDLHPLISVLTTRTRDLNPLRYKVGRRDPFHLLSGLLILPIENKLSASEQISFQRLKPDTPCQIKVLYVPSEMRSIRKVSCLEKLTLLSTDGLVWYRRCKVSNSETSWTEKSWMIINNSCMNYTMRL